MQYIAKAIVGGLVYLLMQYFNLPVPEGVQLALEALIVAVSVWAVPNKPQP